MPIEMRQLREEARPSSAHAAHSAQMPPGMLSLPQPLLHSSGLVNYLPYPWVSGTPKTSTAGLRQFPPHPIVSSHPMSSAPKLSDLATSSGWSGPAHGWGGRTLVLLKVVSEIRLCYHSVSVGLPPTLPNLPPLSARWLAVQIAATLRRQ